MENIRVHGGNERGFNKIDLQELLGQSRQIFSGITFYHSSWETEDMFAKLPFASKI